MTHPTARERIEKLQRRFLDPAYTVPDAFSDLLDLLRDFMAEREQAKEQSFCRCGHRRPWHMGGAGSCGMMLCNCQLFEEPNAPDLPCNTQCAENGGCVNCSPATVPPTAPAPHTAAGEERCVCGHLRQHHSADTFETCFECRCGGFREWNAPAPDVGRELIWTPNGSVVEREDYTAIREYQSAVAARVRGVHVEYGALMDEEDKARRNLLSRFAALRQRVAAAEGENAALRKHLDQRASGTDPLTTKLREDNDKLEAELSTLRAEQAAGIEGIVRLNLMTGSQFVAFTEPNHLFESGTPVRVTVRTKERTP